MRKKKVEVLWIEDNRWKKKVFKNRKKAEEFARKNNFETYYILGG